MKKILKFILSRTFLFGALIAIQLGLFLWLILQFSQAGSYAYLILTLISVFVVILVLEHAGTNPAYKIMWLLIVIMLPVSGAIFYLLWGKPSIKPKRAAHFLDLERKAAAAMEPDPEVSEAASRSLPDMRRTMEYLSTNSAAPVYRDTKAEYYPMGQDFFASFLREIKTAKKYIFLEYFIIHEGDEMWESTLEILKQKAAEGVDVRVIYDGFGSMFTLSSDYDETLRKAGVQCRVFNPLQFSWHLADYKLLNHRDHRKIAIVDGEVGFTGGLNFADEYINKKSRFGVWKDTGLMLKGPGVYSLTVTFLKMWDFVAGTATRYQDYRPAMRYEAADGFVQPYCDSPLDDENVSESAYFNLIHAARNTLDIVTPYLILDNEMVTSLCLAAKSGVQVRILVPGVPDKWYVYYVTQSYYSELLRAGVRIYEYEPGFLHAKMYVCDGEAAIVGSANMDYRSLYLHFENCCIFYGGHMVEDVRQDIAQTLRQCREVTLADTEHVPLYKWLAQVFLRFFAPLM